MACSSTQVPCLGSSPWFCNLSHGIRPLDYDDNMMMMMIIQVCNTTSNNDNNSGYNSFSYLLTPDRGIWYFYFESAIDDRAIGSEVDPSFIGRGIEPCRLWQSTTTSAVDHIVGSIASRAAPVASAHCVVCLLSGEVFEYDWERAALRSRELPDAVEVNPVTEVGEEGEGDHDISIVRDVKCATTTCN